MYNKIIYKKIFSSTKRWGQLNQNQNQELDEKNENFYLKKIAFCNVESA